MANIKKDFASPNGPILLLSAKGSTTASIAEANGVKDFSGNGNHGQAYGGVTVVNDVELGECFSFDGTDDYIIGNNILQDNQSFTFVCRFNSHLSNAEVGRLINVFTRQNNNYKGFSSIVNGKSGFIFQFFNSSSESTTQTIAYDLSDEKPYFLILKYDNGNKKIYAEVDSQTILDMDWTYGISFHNSEKIYIGTGIGTQLFKGLISDFKIYPRVLSAAEVKYLYNGFQPNLIMGQTIPSGAILDLSARGLTTAGIAQANGVIDRSGNGNHGQAYNGVAVVNDDEMGSCFSFKGNTGCSIVLNSIGDTSNDNGYTVSLCLSNNQFTDSQWFICRRTPSDNSVLDWQLIYYQSQLRWDVWDINQSHNPITYSTPNINEKHVYTLTADVSSKVVRIYMDGVKKSEITLQANPSINNTQVVIGTDWRGPSGVFNADCKINDVKIYPRVLTASEVQQLADASLKKVRGVNMGSNLIKHIYYGSNLIYAKTKDYLLTRTFTRSQLSSTTLSSPSRAVFISPAGNMFATDWSSRCVKIFDSTGTYVRSFTPLSGKIPYGINGDATYLYVTYWDSPKIYKYQYSGTDVPTLKNTWTTSHQYNDGTDVYNGCLYVACAYDHVIMKIDVSSGAVTEIATGMTYSLNDLAIDKVNSRIVTIQNGGENNGTKGHIIIYDMSGNLLVDKEMNGTYASKMDSPQGVAVDADGYIYLGGAYTSTGSYNQGFMVMNKNLNILYDLTQSECPTFCYTFNYDSYHNRVVWIGTSSPYIYGIDL